MFMFLYRYLQTTQNPKLKLLLKPKNTFLGFFLFTLLAVLFINIPLELQMRTSDELEEGLRQADPNLYERVKGQVLSGFSVSFLRVVWREFWVVECRESLGLKIQ